MQTQTSLATAAPRVFLPAPQPGEVCHPSRDSEVYPVPEIGSTVEIEAFQLAGAISLPGYPTGEQSEALRERIYEVLKATGRDRQHRPTLTAQVVGAQWCTGITEGGEAIHVSLSVGRLQTLWTQYLCPVLSPTPFLADASLPIEAKHVEIDHYLLDFQEQLVVSR